jgi:hypothetical protein
VCGDLPEASRLTPPWPVLRRCREEGVDAVALLAFATDGDNVPDAMALAGCARRYLAAAAEAPKGGAANGAPGADEEWVIPASWRFVYGRPRSQTILC